MSDRVGVVPGPLVVVCGLPGSGKTTLARPLAVRLRGCLLASDTVRRELGLYGDYRRETIERIYDELMRRASLALRGGPVVLDATFSDRRYRDAAIRTATEAGAAWHLLLMRADDEVAVERVRRRRDDSEAGPEALALLRSAFDPVSLPHLVLDSSGTSVEELVRRAEAFVRARPPALVPGGA